LPLHGSTVATFSPDGRWLMTNTSGGGCRLWEAGTWREVRRFHDADFAFSPDSRLLALADVVSVIRLVETATGREVARLTGPEPLWYQPACFTPDGTRLISTGPDASTLYVWDLRLIRWQLKELGLDWDWPQFAEPDATQKAKPKNVEVLPGELGQALRAVERNSNETKSDRNNEAPP
jgi:WD40 repeat protein